MKSYLQIVQEMAEGHDIPLLKAFKQADIPTSTYYRTINGDSEMRYETALKVSHAIEHLHLLQQARAHTAGLRSAGQEVNRRSVRAKFKPRTTGA